MKLATARVDAVCGISASKAPRADNDDTPLLPRSFGVVAIDSPTASRRRRDCCRCAVDRRVWP
jgi:hypothetical protein